MNLADWLAIAGALLTVMVLLYLFIGDNALFRLITYIFVGVASGYVAALIVFQVLLPRLISPLQNWLQSGNLFGSAQLLNIVLSLIPFLLGLLLLFKLSTGATAGGKLSMAILVGVGAAVAVGGAIFGTLAGQIGGTIGLFSRSSSDFFSRSLEGVFVLIGAICTLAYFQFSTRSRVAAPAAEGAVRRGAMVEILGKIGQVFIGITLGAMFAGVFAASIAALVERIGYLFDVLTRFIKFT